LFELLTRAENSHLREDGYYDLSYVDPKLSVQVEPPLTPEQIQNKKDVLLKNIKRKLASDIYKLSEKKSELMKLLAPKKQEKQESIKEKKKRGHQIEADIKNLREAIEKGNAEIFELDKKLREKKEEERMLKNQPLPDGPPERFFDLGEEIHQISKDINKMNFTLIELERQKREREINQHENRNAIEREEEELKRLQNKKSGEIEKIKNELESVASTCKGIFERHYNLDFIERAVKLEFKRYRKHLPIYQHQKKYVGKGVVVFSYLFS